MVQEEMSAVEAVKPPATKEDYIIFLLERLVNTQEEKEGAVERMLPFEGAIAAAGLAGDSVRLEADFPHDAWVVYARADANVTLRIWPGGTPPASGAIELRNNLAVRIKSTSNTLHIVNTGSAAGHYFAIALSLAEVDFYALA